MEFLFLRLQLVQTVTVVITLSCVVLAEGPATETWQAKTWSRGHPVKDYQRFRPAYREITRQTLSEAYKLAERGDFEGAVQLVQRAKWLATASPKTVPTYRTSKSEIMSSRRRHYEPSRLSIPDEFDSPAPSDRQFGNANKDFSSNTSTLRPQTEPAHNALGETPTRPRNQIDTLVGAKTGATVSRNANVAGQSGQHTGTGLGDARVRSVKSLDGKQPPQKTYWLATALVHLISTVAGSLIGLMIIGATLYFVLSRCVGQLGPVLKIELATPLGSGLSPAVLGNTQPGGSVETPIPSRSDLPLVLGNTQPGGSVETPILSRSDLPISVPPQISLYEQKVKTAPEAEQAMLRSVLEQNIRFRKEIWEVQESAAARNGI